MEWLYGSPVMEWISGEPSDGLDIRSRPEPGDGVDIGRGSQFTGPTALLYTIGFEL